MTQNQILKNTPKTLPIIIVGKEGRLSHYCNSEVNTVDYVRLD